PTYVQTWLDGELPSFCWQIYRDGSMLERRVLDWCLENLPMLRQLPQHPHWLFVSYEDLMTHTVEVIDVLCQRLELTDRERMLARIRRPSRSTRRESTPERKRMIRRGDRQQLRSSWRQHVSDQQVDACFQLLERFGIDLYSRDSDMPDGTSVCRTSFGHAATCSTPAEQAIEKTVR
ncbi:MAG: hypothetical protein KDA99_22635, partial [Planctomycetales bacterium]|nr:hypothetical protein [Planctomycetales bacterium]